MAPHSVRKGIMHNTQLNTHTHCKVPQHSNTQSVVKRTLQAAHQIQEYRHYICIKTIAVLMQSWPTIHAANLLYAIFQAR